MKDDLSWGCLNFLIHIIKLYLTVKTQIKNKNKNKNKNKKYNI